jgi:hypothetical protein
MKTMNRSLQMLNVARLNVKAQKSQGEADLQAGEPRGADRHGKRRSSDKDKTGAENHPSKPPPFFCILELPRLHFSVHPVL